MGTNPRSIRNRSLEAWRKSCRAIDEIKGSTEGLTWAVIPERIQDPIADRAIEATGGHHMISIRDRYNESTLETRFRTAYEQLLERQPEAS